MTHEDPAPNPSTTPHKYTRPPRPRPQFSTTTDALLVERLRAVSKATGISMARIIEDGTRARIAELERALPVLAGACSAIEGAEPTP